MSVTIEYRKTDVLILGAGGAGLFAALHADKGAVDLDITVAVKGLLGKSGCTRMVQGGYNAAMAEDDSEVRHYMDTIEGGKWLNHQELAWTLVNEAPIRIRELENELGCYFDRNPDGTLHQKAFAGQTYDRTVHKGDLTGIEIINRLSEQVWKRGINRLEDHRALEFIMAADGSGLSGVLMTDIRTGEFLFVQAKAVLLATGGGPSMYRYHTPSGDKSCDGMAMSLRAGLTLRDMEMVQFHPTGLIAGEDTRITGTIIEEGLRGYGGYLLDGNEERFMHKYDDRNERATRDIVSRAMYSEMTNGATGPNGGLYITMRHLDEAEVRKRFKGMVTRCADCGFDLVSGVVEVVPTAHYMMGGLEFNVDCSTECPGLFAAGEDTGGVHGANRLGGNGVANSTVFGGLAGDTLANWVPAEGVFRDPDKTALAAAAEAALHPFTKPLGDLPSIRERLYTAMWNDAGIIRDGKRLERAKDTIQSLGEDLSEAGITTNDRAYNLTWHDWLNLNNLILVSKVIIEAAIVRDDSRGAHYRTDYPDVKDVENSWYTRVKMNDGTVELTTQPVEFTRVRPAETLLD
jgi:fumarate reductase flavoprotein subunit